MDRKLRHLILWVFRLPFFRSRDAVLGDVLEEYSGGKRSVAWVCRQAFSTVWTAPSVNVATEPGAGLFSTALASFWTDLLYTVRTLRKDPGFTIIAVLVVALGIGVNTGIFTILNGAVLRQLPVPASKQLVSVFQIFRGGRERNVHGAASMFSTSEYRDYRDHNHVFSGMLAYEPYTVVTLGGQQPRQLFGQLSSCNYFDVLNERPGLGRGFVSSECASPGVSRVVVISHDFWRGSFAADPGIIGKDIVLNRQPFTVIGVAPANFRGTEPIPCAFWAPLTMQAVLSPGLDLLTKDNMSWLVLLGRMKPGISLEQVRADLGVIAGRIDQLYPGRKTTLSVSTATLLGVPEQRKIVTGVASIILAAVGLVLLIACANMANLLLARAAGRYKEIAIRLSVGASRWRLIRQLLTESVLIALLGGALGSIVAFWSFQGILSFVTTRMPQGFPPLAIDGQPDLRVFSYALALSVLTGVVFGLVPALQVSRPDLNEVLKREGSSSVTTPGGLLRSTLVGAQVAVCMILLIASGLLMRGLYAAQTIDPGFDLKNVTVISFDLRGQGYSLQGAQVFAHRLMERLASLPGIETVAEAGVIPLSDSHRSSQFSIAGEAESRRIEFNNVSPEYFSLLGIPIVRGRDFTENEVRAEDQVGIVTESTARRLWPGQDPTGKSLREVGGKNLQIVGVAKDAQVSHLAESNTTYLYRPAGPKEQLRFRLLARSAPGLVSVAKDIQSAAHDLDPDLLVETNSLESNLEIFRAPSRIVASLSGCLGAIALLLASVGVYGTVSYGVSRRTREMGIRMTLGANSTDVLSITLRQALRPVVIGAVIGIGACIGVSRVLSRMLFGVSPHDPITLALVPLFLLAVALVASYVPARRATQVDPMVALRYE